MSAALPVSASAVIRGEGNLRCISIPSEDEMRFLTHMCPRALRVRVFMRYRSGGRDRSAIRFECSEPFDCCANRFACTPRTRP
jgi:hypothetical protein